jgi:chaperonin cofactor prefoldin
MTIDEVNSQLSRTGRNKPTAVKQTSNLPDRLAAIRAKLADASQAAVELDGQLIKALALMPRVKPSLIQARKRLQGLRTNLNVMSAAIVDIEATQSEVTKRLTALEGK